MSSKKFIVVIILTILFTGSDKLNNILVNDYIKYNSMNSIQECEYSDEYKKWLELSDEDKKIFMMPNVCKKIKEVNESILPNYSVSIFNDTLEDNSIPEKYDLRDVNGNNYVTSVKNQEYTGTCWTFAANSSIESNILKSYGKTYDFAELHISYYSSENYFTDGKNYDGNSTRVAGDGGNGFATSSYLTKLKGPILENDFPFDKYYDENIGTEKNVYLETISLDEMRTQVTNADVNSIDFLFYESCTDEALNAIKKTIMEKGVVQASYYHSSSYTNGSYIYYNGTNGTNHAISIVGWDDTISRTKFKSSVRPTNNGAFIIKNSWGTSAGDNGYYYISYEDTNICKSVISYNNIDFEVEDNAYYYDVLGMTGYISDNTESSSYIFTSNKYNKKTDSRELLKEVTIGFLSESEYEVYLANYDDLNERTLIGSGYGNLGYHTLTLEKPILIEDDFAIVVKYISSSPKASIQSANISGYETTTLESNQSFYSFNGVNWYDFTNLNNTFIPSIKAYTDNYDYDFSLNEPVRIDNTDIFNIPVTLNNITIDKFEIKIYDNNKNDVTNEFTIKNNIIANNNIYLEKNSINTENGIYTLSVTYDTYITKEISFEIIDSYQEININNISYIPNTIYDDKNKIYDNTGGNIKIKFTKYNIDIEDILIEIKTSDTIVDYFDYTINTFDNYYILDIDIPSNTIYGEYIVKIYKNDIYDDITFNIYEYIEVNNLNIKYNNKDIDNIVLIKNDTLNIESTIIPDNTTIKDIKYEIKNKTIATINEDGLITGLSVGNTTLTSSIDNVSKVINITVIDPKTSFETEKVSNINTNLEIDNYYGGEFNTLISFDNINIDKGIDVKILNNNNEDVSNYFTIEKSNIIDNKVNIKIIYDGNNKVNFGTYKVFYYYNLNDTKNTSKNEYYEINLIEYIPVESISSNKDEYKLYVGDTLNINDINIQINPNNSTIKTYNYEVVNSDIVSLKNDVLTGLKVGETILRVSSLNVVKDIIIIVLEDKYLKFDESLELIYKDNINYLKSLDNKLIHSTLLSKINTNYEIKIYDLKNNLIVDSSTKITTGTTLEINNILYNIAISGEVNGDGKINYLDYVNVYNHIYKTKHPESNKTLLNNEYLIAADVSNEGKISYLDYVKIYNKIKELKGGTN